jgi:hypothetical protein
LLTGIRKEFDLLHQGLFYICFGIEASEGWREE